MTETTLLEKMWRKLRPLYEHIDQLNYYQILGVNDTASAQEITGAYQRIAMLLHPDRHYQNREHRYAKRIYKLFKRMTEAHQVLSNAARRGDYDRQLKSGTLRYDSSSAKFVEAARLDQTMRTPEGREFVELGMALAEQGDPGGARMNYQMALGFEPDNQRLQTEIERLTREMSK